MTQSRKKWTGAEEKKLKTLKEKGTSDRMIAEKMKRPIGSITNKVEKMGLGNISPTSGINNITGVKRMAKVGNKTKRLVILSDLHCGHEAGLTPPKYRSSGRAETVERQEEAWEWYANEVKNVGKNIDALLLNGDTIDGRQDRQGGSELIINDRIDQVDCAFRCINKWNPKQVFITRGTPYHTGYLEQWEDILDARIRERGIPSIVDDYLQFEINGRVFDCRHKVGSSSIPHGMSTAASKEAIWLLLEQIKNELDNKIKNPFVIRSHVHYYSYAETALFSALVTPALQVDSRYGRQMCSGMVNFGFVVLDIKPDGTVIHDKRLAVLQSKITKIHKVK